MGIYVDRGLTLAQAKETIKIEIEVWYGGKVLDVFDSSVLGTPHRYYCDESSQLRMLNGRVSNIPMELMCGLIPSQPDTDPVYQWKQHTATECGKVHQAYLTFSADAAQQRVTYLNQAEAATSVLQIDAIYEAMFG